MATITLGQVRISDDPVMLAPRAAAQGARRRAESRETSLAAALASSGFPVLSPRALPDRALTLSRVDQVFGEGTSAQTVLIVALTYWDGKGKFVTVQNQRLTGQVNITVPPVLRASSIAGAPVALYSLSVPAPGQPSRRLALHGCVLEKPSTFINVEGAGFSPDEILAAAASLA
jgi:hypothetical protein